MLERAGSDPDFADAEASPFISSSLGFPPGAVRLVGRPRVASDTQQALPLAGNGKLACWCHWAVLNGRQLESVGVIIEPGELSGL